MDYNKISQIVQGTVRTLREGLRPTQVGYYVLLSPGPGHDGPADTEKDRGAPGMSSAVALRLCVEAVGKENVRAATFVIGGVTNPIWAARAGEYATSLGVLWEPMDITPVATAYCADLKEKGTEIVPASVATRLRSLYASHLAGHAFKTTNGCTIIQRSFFPVSNLDDYSDAAPVGNCDRTTTIAIGRYLGVPEYILTQRPSNGSLQEGTRMMNRIFTGIPYDASLPGVLDQFLVNLRGGRDPLKGLEERVAERPGIVAAAQRAKGLFEFHRGQTEVVIGSVQT